MKPGTKIQTGQVENLIILQDQASYYPKVMCLLFHKRNEYAISLHMIIAYWKEQCLPHTK